MRANFMTLHITTSRVEPSSDRHHACHFDELSDKAKDCLVEVVENEIPAGVDPDIATELVQYDLIKFVDYYNVQITESGVSGSVSA